MKEKQFTRYLNEIIFVLMFKWNASQMYFEYSSNSMMLTHPALAYSVESRFDVGFNIYK